MFKLYICACAITAPFWGRYYKLYYEDGLRQVVRTPLWIQQLQ